MVQDVLLTRRGLRYITSLTLSMTSRALAALQLLSRGPIVLAMSSYQRHAMELGRSGLRQSLFDGTAALSGDRPASSAASGSSRGKHRVAASPRTTTTQWTRRTLLRRTRPSSSTTPRWLAAPQTIVFQPRSRQRFWNSMACALGSVPTWAWSLRESRRDHCRDLG